MNIIAPGGIVTPRFKASRQLDEARAVREGTLEGYGDPLDIARAVAYLASEGGAFMSGQVLRIDGGVQVWPA